MARPGSTRVRLRFPADRPGAALVALAPALLVAPGARAAAPAFGPPFALQSHAGSDVGSDSTPAIASDGAGRWIAVWSTDDSMDGMLGPDSDLLVARSDDGGATWSDPEALDAGASSDGAVDVEPALATDGAGTWLVVWSSENPLGGALGNDPDLLVARSEDGGVTWSAPQPLNSNAGVDAGRDSQPRLVADGSGTWVAVWTSRDSLGGTVGTDDDILFARSVDAGASWSPPSILYDHAAADSGSDTNPSLAADGAGGWLVAWQSRDSFGGTLGTDFDVLAVRSADGGVTWSSPEPVDASAATGWGADFFPAACSDGLGGWLVAWESRESLGGLGSDSDVLIARAASASAPWSGPVPLHADAASDSKQDGAPVLMDDGHGHVLAAWASNGPAATLGTDFDVVYAFSEDGGVTWSAPSPVHANADADSGVDTGPSLATDRSGRWMAAWRSSDPLGGTLGNDFDPLAAVGVQPAVCGDGRLHADEVCDGGPECRADCTLAVCGDGILDPGEACDDGNGVPGDGCRADCTVELCGDGIPDPGEACDGGPACRSDCTLAFCGDGIPDPGEACDDGNGVSGDGCDASCQIEAPGASTVGDLLDAFDAAVEAGSLHGMGPGQSGSNRLRALRSMLASAAGTAGETCGPLAAFARRLDGSPRPPDFAAGPAAATLASDAEQMLGEHGCPGVQPLERGRATRR